MKLNGIRAMHRRRCVILLTLVLFYVDDAAELAGQTWCTLDCTPPNESSLVSRHATALAINAGLGAFAVSLNRLLSGESPWPGAVSGLIGGGITYGGKYLAAQRFGGAAYLGRQVAAAGNSIVRNAAQGQDLLEHLTLPVGPVRIYVRSPFDPVDRAIFVRADLMTLAAAGFVVVDRGAQFDVSTSLSTGTLVMRSSESPSHAGSHFAGLVLLPELAEGFEETNRFLLTHEIVHVLQQDQAFDAFGVPSEEWLGRHLSTVRLARKWFDLNLTAALLPLLGLQWQYRNRPWEREAYLLTEHFQLEE